MFGSTDFVNRPKCKLKILWNSNELQVKRIAQHLVAGHEMYTILWNSNFECHRRKNCTEFLEQIDKVQVILELLMCER